MGKTGVKLLPLLRELELSAPLENPRPAQFPALELLRITEKFGGRAIFADVKAFKLARGSAEELTRLTKAMLPTRQPNPAALLRLRFHLQWAPETPVPSALTLLHRVGGHPFALQELLKPIVECMSKEGLVAESTEGPNGKACI